MVCRGIGWNVLSAQHINDAHDRSNEHQAENSKGRMLIVVDVRVAIVRMEIFIGVRMTKLEARQLASNSGECRSSAIVDLE